MSVNIRYPSITGITEKEQLTQIRSFLHQLVEQLNYALTTLGTDGGSTQAASPQACEVQGGEMAYSELMALIIQELQKINGLIDSHVIDKSNPHGVTKEQVGLGNVPNVATNDQTPSFTEASALGPMVSGETLSAAFGKIAKAITDLISHIENQANPHGVTAKQVGVDPMLWLGFDAASWSSTGTFQADLEAAFSQMLQGTCKQVQFVDTNLNTQKFTGTIWKYTGDYGFLTATNYSGWQAVKTYYGGTWNPWEWENPPFAPGVEYRTTDRINSKTVFKRMTSAGVVEYRLDGETVWQTYAAQVGAAPADYSVFDLLWSNPSQASGFAAQTLSVDTSAYNYLAIEVSYNEKDLNGSKVHFVGMRKSANTVATLTANLITSTGSRNTVWRKLTVNSNRLSIVVGGGIGADGSENNNNAIPIKIYGVKGV